LKGLFTALPKTGSLGIGVVVEVGQPLEGVDRRANTRASSAAADANFACASRKATVSTRSELAAAFSDDWPEWLISDEVVDIGPNERE
jgi:hypothetical protein